MISLDAQERDSLHSATLLLTGRPHLLNALNLIGPRSHYTGRQRF